MEIAEVVAIGAAHAQRLGAAGVATTEDLLAQARTRRARRRLAISTGLAETLLLRWANQVDLLTLDGVSQDYAALLEAAGVNCADELARRDPQQLSATLADLIASRLTMRHVPDPDEVATWIVQAQQQALRVEQ